jgi:hypothetical protein
MHLLVISLLTILAGTLLLAKFKKDMPGKIFAYISWFFIVVGFILFIGFIGGSICKFAHHGFPCQQNRCEMMMKGPGPEMHGCFCCPPGMDKGMCCKGPGPMSHDSMMKCCPKHMMKCDSVKPPAPKK